MAKIHHYLKFVASTFFRITAQRLDMLKACFRSNHKRDPLNKTFVGEDFIYFFTLFFVLNSHFMRRLHGGAVKFLRDTLSVVVVERGKGSLKI